jgi:hypothetical protein
MAALVAQTATPSFRPLAEMALLSEFQDIASADLLFPSVWIPAFAATTVFRLA